MGQAQDEPGSRGWRIAHGTGRTGILAPMSTSTHPTAQSGATKTARNPVKVIPVEGAASPEAPVDPGAGSGGGRRSRGSRDSFANSASSPCARRRRVPNLGECFSHGTATFMVMGELCTRRCPFCDVAHGRPDPLDPAEPLRLATTVARLGLRHVVITSVDRDDLRDGGAGHFASCVRAVRGRTPSTRVEILVPDFRGRMERALDALAAAPPDVFNHNLETVPRLYRKVRPGADLRLVLEAPRALRGGPTPGFPPSRGSWSGSGRRTRRSWR